MPGARRRRPDVRLGQPRPVRLGRVGVVEEVVEGPAQARRPGGPARPARGPARPRTAARVVAVELAHRVIEQVIGSHRVNRPHRVATPCAISWSLARAAWRRDLTVPTGNLEDLGDLAVLQVLVIRQASGSASAPRAGGRRSPGHPVAPLLLLHLGQRSDSPSPTSRSISAPESPSPEPSKRGGRGLTVGWRPGLAGGVDGLVRGDRVEPGADRPAVLVQRALQVDLQERVLEHVLGQRGGCRDTGPGNGTAPARSGGPRALKSSGSA